MKTTILFSFLGLAAATLGRAEEQLNLVANGSFEDSRGRPGVPDDWKAVGNPKIKQQLTLDTGRDGKSCGQLTCSEFTAGGPDFHVMLCQTGRVSVQRGHWYRLTFWAKGQDIQDGAVEVALSNTRSWENAGLAEAFLPHRTWERSEMVFRAKTDVPAAASRLQFWFKSTGTLWLDDVTLTETTDAQQWLPQITADGVKNLIPNSSFECGGANWGSFTWGLGGWAGNLYRLEGELDQTQAQDGQHSWRISLNPQTEPVFWFDYYEPVRQPVRRVLVANQGWFRVQPGEPLTLSAWLRADAEGVVAQLAANEAPSRLLHKSVTVGRQGQRQAFTFRPTQPYLFIAVGLDLEASRRDAATLWVDAVQLERGDQATAYEPRQAVESFIETDVPGHVFRQVAQGATFRARACNHSGQPQSVQGQLKVTDFFDRVVRDETLEFAVPTRAAASATVANVGPGRRGFYRAQWTAGGATQSLRSAVIEPLGPETVDSPLGFNHAYPWDFLVRQARDAGLVWWRDWSAQWNLVEPERGRFQFPVPDEQIRRVLHLGGRVEVLLPFPSASWSTTARPEEIQKAAPQAGYLRSRLPLAYAPQDLADFGKYAAEVVRRYRREQPSGVTHYQILNEPIYTNYALPSQFGYRLADYLRLLAAASGAMKAADPQCQVVGGISANLRSPLTSEFVTQGGLQWLDVFDLHVYDPPRPVENYEAPFRALAELMHAHGGPKPVWITEWGCYADDDPACLPQTVGDETMNRCRWPSERAATEHIVKFTALSFAHGVRKIFFHAGTCGTINGPDAGGVLFEYGGTPRKMYAGVAALTKLLGVPEACVQVLQHDGTQAYVFRTAGRAVAIAWQEEGRTKPLQLASQVTAYDVLGNELPAADAALSASPMYLVAPTPEAIRASL